MHRPRFRGPSCSHLLCSGLSLAGRRLPLAALARLCALDCCWCLGRGGVGIFARRRRRRCLAKKRAGFRAGCLAGRCQCSKTFPSMSISQTHLRLCVLLDVLVLILGIVLCIRLLLLSSPFFRFGLHRLTLVDKCLDKGTLLAVGEMFLAVGEKSVRQLVGLVVVRALPCFHVRLQHTRDHRSPPSRPGICCS